MGIWVRSQDRVILANIASMNIDHINRVCGFDKCNNATDAYYYLGHYSSKEKAIKVLDMIQSYILNTPSYTSACGVDEWATYGKEPFQMPLDEEVEEHGK